MNRLKKKHTTLYSVNSHLSTQYTRIREYSGLSSALKDATVRIDSLMERDLRRFDEGMKT